VQWQNYLKCVHEILGSDLGRGKLPNSPDRAGRSSGDALDFIRDVTRSNLGRCIIFLNYGVFV
jgi:hypothetical protein